MLGIKRYLKVYKILMSSLAMAKLQKQLSRKVGDKEYPKYVVVIPPEKIKEAKLGEGYELEISVSKGKIILNTK